MKMSKNLEILKAKLDSLILEKNTQKALFAAPDPLQIATLYKDEFVCLICALFAYGNAKNILAFLKKLDFSLLNESEDKIKKALKALKYRFQSEMDLAQIFITLRRLKQENSLKNIFLKGYAKREFITDGLRNLMDEIYAINKYQSFGYEFFFSKPFKNAPQSPLKRYNMLLRWLVRKDGLDLGLWNCSVNLNENSSQNSLNLSPQNKQNLHENSSEISHKTKNPKNLAENSALSIKNQISSQRSKIPSNALKTSEISTANLLIPLDTHTHKVALNFGLLQRKSYDFKAVLELSKTLRKFDPKDPIKYDFALYRLGQSKEYLDFKHNF